MKSLLPILMLAAGLAACSSGSVGPDAQAAAGVSEPEAMSDFILKIKWDCTSLKQTKMHKIWSSSFKFIFYSLHCSKMP